MRRCLSLIAIRSLTSTAANSSGLYGPKARRFDPGIQRARGNSKWSYARVDDRGIVLEVREKIAISELALSASISLLKLSYFIDAAIDMIAAQ